jgi:molybdate transport system ATP-binding protein
LARRLKRSSRRRSDLRSIELDRVSVRRGAHWALRDIGFELRAGQRWLLTGANGAGKTMFMKLLRGDVWPTPTGRESRVYDLGGERQDQPLFARERIGYLGPESQDKFERYEWNLRVLDVVTTGYSGSDLPLERMTRAQRAGALRALRDVRLASLAERRFLTLSNGQRRRVLLARLLVSDPDVLLLDEVLNGLDVGARRSLLAALRRIASPRRAWMLSSHRVAEIPRDVTHVARLERGRLVEAGPASTVRRGRARADDTPRGDDASPRSQPALRRQTPPLLRLRDVSVYRDYRTVVQRLDWTIARGEHWLVAGENGSGKSTLIALLYGDLQPAEGGVVERAGMPRGRAIERWKSRLGLVSPELQATYAATRCTLLDLIVSGLHSSIGLNRPATRREVQRATRVASTLDLTPLLARGTRELSYGQLRMGLFARALIARRELLLLDEPFDGLDTAWRTMIEQRIAAAVRDGTQLVIATHHPDDAPPFVTRTLDLADFAPTTSRR